MKKFYFYGAVTYPTKNFQEIPKGSIGLHYINAENEESAKKEFTEKYEKLNNNLYIVNMFGEKSKFKYKWYGEIAEEESIETYERELKE